MLVRVIIFIALLWGTFLFALWKGGRSERAVAIIQMTAAQMSHFMLSPRGPHGRYHALELGVFGTDVLAFFAFFAVALVSRKYWPMWIAAMQGVALLSHLSPALPGVIPDSYGLAVQLWSWPMQVILGVATWLHMRERQAERRAAHLTMAG